MTSKEANQVVQESLSDHHVETFPIADGGEGTVDAFINILDGRFITETITGPNGKKIEGVYGWVANQKLAIIEVAEGAGITKVPVDSLDPRKHTSFGVGEQILSALNLGAKEIIIGLGGSATIDGGVGLLQALGVTFYNQIGNLLDTLPIDLNQITRIDSTNLDNRLEDITLTVASDVSNPLCGPKGATYIFGLQKGLKETELETFENAMIHYQNVVNQATQTTKQQEPAAGAAGGIGFAFYSFFNTNFQSGFALLADKGHLASKICLADVVITGEGKFDRQTIQGKVPIGISRIAKSNNVPTIVFTGNIEGDILHLPEENIKAVIPIVDRAMTLTEAMENGPKLLGMAVKRTFHLINLTF